MATESEVAAGGSAGEVKEVKKGTYHERRPKQLPIANLKAEIGAHPLTTSGPGSPGVLGLSPPRVSVSNPSGKRREIVQIQKPSSIQDFYDFGSILGKGGFGVVSEILHAKTFQPFAGKVVQKNNHRDDDEETFRKVMEVLLNCEHPHVVNFIHCFEDDPNYYIVMEKMDGGTLYSYIKQNGRPLSASTAEPFCRETLFALDFLHKSGMIHRDIKPENLMLSGPAPRRRKPDDDASPKSGGIPDDFKPGSIKVVDFDMCCFLQNGEVQSRSLQGTPGYLAPEVLEQKRYTVRSDLFSFGCVMYTMMRGKQPCPEMSFGNRKNYHELRAQMDKWLEEVVFAKGKDKSSSSQSAKKPDSGSPKTPQDPDSNAAGDGKADEELQATLEKLMKWCLDKKELERPASAAAVFQAGFLGDPHSPTGSRSPDSPKSKGEKRKKNRKPTQIDELLKLSSNDPLSPMSPPKPT